MKAKVFPNLKQANLLNFRTYKQVNFRNKYSYYPINKTLNMYIYSVYNTLPLMLKIRLCIKNSFINLENVTFLGNFEPNLSTDQIERI